MGSKSNLPIEQLSYTKSNAMICAKYNSTLLEDQLMAIAQTRMQINYNDKDCPLEARLYPGELKRLVSDEAHIYRDLKKVATAMPGRTMLLEDGKGNFTSFSIVPNADYINGEFIIKFNNSLRDHLFVKEQSFTKLALSVMSSFESHSAFRLYEVLLKDSFRIPAGEGAFVEVEYNISELKFIMGLANIDSPTAKKEMGRMGKNIDWDALYEKLDSKDRFYPEWSEFKRRVIDPAQKEISQKGNIAFSYEKRRGAKIITFKIFKNNPTHKKEVNEKEKILESFEKERQLEIPFDLYHDLYMEYVGHNDLTKEDIDYLIKIAENVEQVKYAIQKADEQPHLDNYMGWIVKCIKDKYVFTETVRGSAEKADVFNEIIDTYETNKPQIAKRAWDKIKNKAEFGDFEKELETNGMVVEQLEVIYEAEELVKCFTDWKLGRGINI